jgi:hypothetical protein
MKRQFLHLWVASPWWGDRRAADRVCQHCAAGSEAQCLSASMDAQLFCYLTSRRDSSHRYEPARQRARARAYGRRREAARPCLTSLRSSGRRAFHRARGRHDAHPAGLRLHFSLPAATPHASLGDPHVFGDLGYFLAARESSPARNQLCLLRRR